MALCTPSEDLRLLCLVDADSPDDPESPNRLVRARELIDSGCDLHGKNKWGETAFSLAVRNGFLIWVELFLEHGQKISQVTTLVEFLDSSWPRHPTRIQRQNFTAILSLYMSEQPDLTGRNDRGMPLLVIAGKEGNSTAIHALLTAGADPNMSSCHGLTPLEAICNFAWRARAECFKAIDDLIKHGANPNNPNMSDNENHKSSLTWAVYCGGNTVTVVQLLLDAGANPTAVDSEGISVLEYTRKSKRPDLEDIIKKTINKK